VVPRSEVIPKALEIARQITHNSPDSVQSSKRGLLLSQFHNHEETVLKHAWSTESKRVYKGENIKAGHLSPILSFGVFLIFFKIS
jgi:hypothetical protein